MTEIQKGIYCINGRSSDNNSGIKFDNDKWSTTKITINETIPDWIYIESSNNGIQF